MGRVSRNEYYMQLAVDVARRSTCTRRRIGAVIVNGDVIVSTGYNGNPRGLPHCAEIGCIRDELSIPSGERMEICTAVHAEQNALIFAGKEAAGGILYSTIVPCNTCAKMIINAGVRRVVYLQGYPDLMGDELLRQSGVEVEQLEMDVELPATGHGTNVDGVGLHAERSEEAAAAIREMKEALVKQFKEGEGKSVNDLAVKLLREKAKAREQGD
jgi:dCMP deaminase